MTCFDLEATKRLYTGVLKLELAVFEKTVLAFVWQPENYLHQYGKEYEPKAHLPVPGSLDLCFISKEPIDTVIVELQKHSSPIV